MDHLSDEKIQNVWEQIPSVLEQYTYFYDRVIAKESSNSENIQYMEKIDWKGG